MRNQELFHFQQNVSQRNKRGEVLTGVLLYLSFVLSLLHLLFKDLQVEVSFHHLPALWKNGLCITLNRILSMLVSKEGTIRERFAINEACRQGSSQTIFLISILLILAVLIGFCIWERGYLSTTILLVLHFCVIAVICVEIPSIWVQLPFLFGALHILGKGNDQKANLLQEALVITFIVALLLIGNKSMLQPFAEKTTEWMVEASENIRYKKPNVFYLPQGDFQKLSDFEPGDKTMLSVKGELAQSMYLKGFVGGVYQYGRFQKIEESTLAKSESLFYWLHKNDFYPQKQLGRIYGILEEAQNPRLFEVENHNADSRYRYIPYEWKDGADLKNPEHTIWEGNLSSDKLTGCRRYSFLSYENQVKRYTTLGYKLYEKEESGFLDEEERHYNAYVYDTYTTLPEEHRQLLREILGDYNTEGEIHASYHDVKQQILVTLGEIKYDPIVSEPEKEEDFLTHFLKVSKRGYSVHFAAAATEMFRYYGIPARYVEGYLITPEMAAYTAPGASVEITEKESHAWTEFYQDGIGWIPFETTPPYLNRMEQAEEIGATGESNGSRKLTKPQQQEQEETGASKESTPYSLKSILLIILMLLLLLIIILFGIKKYRKWRYQKNLQKSFALSDKRIALQNRFAYIMKMLQDKGLMLANDSLLNYADEITSKWGSDYANLFKQATDIHEILRFSNNPVQPEWETLIIECQNKTEQLKSPLNI